MSAAFDQYRLAMYRLRTQTEQKTNQKRTEKVDTLGYDTQTLNENI